jgi:hypothetical protein
MVDRSHFRGPTTNVGAHPRYQMTGRSHSSGSALKGSQSGMDRTKSSALRRANV